MHSESARVLIARPNFPASTLPEFVAYAKANHRKMQYGSAGAGSGIHVCSVLLDVAMGTKITHVPYRGAGPAMQDLIAGRIDFIAEQISTALPQIQGGKVKAIATLGLDRAPDLPKPPDRRGDRVEGPRLRRLGLRSRSPKAHPMPSCGGSHRHPTRQWSRRWCATASRRSASSSRRPSGGRPEYLRKFVATETARWAGPIKRAGVRDRLIRARPDLRGHHAESF